VANAALKANSPASTKASPINDAPQPTQSRRWAIAFCLTSLLLTAVSVIGLRYSSDSFWNEPIADPLKTEFATGVLESTDVPNVDLPDDERPNIVLINLDDAERELLAEPVLQKFLPNIHQLASTGLSFNNCHVTTPLCGPSRTCLLYSQHAHRTGVRSNLTGGPLSNGYGGGYQVLAKAGVARQHVGTWMQAAGYRTLAVGKYLHDLPDSFAAPGWDEILMARGDRYFETYYTRARKGREKVQFTADKDDFRTDHESDEMESMLELHKTLTFNRREPFFFYLAPMAPHEPTSGQSMIAPRHEGLATDASLPWAASFDEDDMSDKPQQFQELKALGRYRMVKFEGELDNTVIFLTSDHGYLLGHHRMEGKQVPYSRSTNVPLIVWSSAIEEKVSSMAARGVEHLVSHLDLAPTFLDLAGKPCPRSDGKSFAGLLEAPEAIAPGDWREDLLIQNFERKRVFDDVCQCAYAALRTTDELYVHWANGQREYYDLARDPGQLDNRWADLEREQRQSFERRLRSARVATSTSSAGRPTAPVVTLANPSRWEPMRGNDFTISGMTEDDRAVDTVRLSIQHPETKKFYNGEAWQTEEVQVDAELANRGGILSVWNYALKKGKLRGSRFLNVKVVATNKRGTTVTTGVVEARYPPPAVAVNRQSEMK